MIININKQLCMYWLVFTTIIQALDIYITMIMVYFLLDGRQKLKDCLYNRNMVRCSVCIISKLLMKPGHCMVLLFKISSEVDQTKNTKYRNTKKVQMQKQTLFFPRTKSRGKLVRNS